MTNKKIVLLAGEQRVTNITLHIKFFLEQTVHLEEKKGRKKEHLNQYSVNMLEQSPKPLVICDKDINNSHCQPSLSSDLPFLCPSGCFSLIFSLEREKVLHQANV